MLVIQVATEDGQISTLYLENDWQLTKVHQMIFDQLNIPIADQKLYLDGKLISDSTKTVAESNFKNGDILLVKRSYSNLPLPPLITSNSIDEMLRTKAKDLMDNFVVGSLELESLKLHNRNLYDAISSRSVDRVVEVLSEEYKNSEKNAREHRERLLKAYLDPLDPESQRIIQKEIENERINENYITAQNYLPESFGHIFMLYVTVEINNVSVKALVDTGAQHTIMHKNCAERCDLIRLIDDRFKGVAVGVGSTKTLGKIHLANMKIGSIFIPVSFIVLDYGHIDFILGLDVLRRYACNIDLKRNCLIINDITVPFLAEKDIKSSSKDSPPAVTTLTSSSSNQSSTTENDKVRRLCELLNVTPEYAQELLNIANGDEELAVSFFLPNN